jgi:6-phosphogluconolactonase
VAAEERLFADQAAMAAALADEIASRLRVRVAADGEASLVVTGGSTPGALYDALSQHEARWDRVSLTLTDERWVPTDSEASNERLVRERLLQGRARAARLVPLKTDEATPALAVAGVARALAAMPRPFEASILGMGPDGHFASLFPGNPTTPAGLRPGGADVIAVEAPGAAGSSSRLSLTLAAILDSRWIVILVRGPEKLDLLRRAAGADARRIPIRAVLDQSEVPVSIFWAP